MLYMLRLCPYSQTLHWTEKAHHVQTIQLIVPFVS